MFRYDDDADDDDDDEDLRAEDIVEVNELILPQAFLDDLTVAYHSVNPNGSFNDNNDTRVLQLVDMIIRNATINGGLTRITIV
jgi:hypothetical protein